MAQSGQSSRLLSAEAANGLKMISPTAIYATLMLAVPLGLIFLYSFLSDGYLTIEYKPTFANYIETWTSPVFEKVLMRSLGVSMAVTAVTVLTAFPMAYYVSFYVEPSKKSIWLFLITIPFWTSYLIRVFLWLVILGYNGVVNSSLMGLGVIDEPITAILYNANSVVITLAHAYAPFAILPIFVALEKIDRSLLEAGRDLGESPFMTFVRVTLPLALPGVISAIMIVFIPVIGDYVTPSLLGGPEGKMVANLVQLQYLKLDNYPMGSATAVSSMAMVAVALIVGYAQAKLFKRVYGALMLSTSAGLAFISALAAVLISFGACLVAGLVLGGAFFAYVLSVLVGHVVLFVWLQRRETKA
jgi:spermidine/putrescine transport system permease protein